jgi:hypothetical protein
VGSLLAAIFRLERLVRPASSPAETSSAYYTMLLQAQGRLADFMLGALKGSSYDSGVFVPLGNRNLAKD